MDIHMFYHRFHTFGARIHMFSFCSNKRLKSFFIISFFLAGVFVDITKYDARCLRHTQIGCSWISSEVFKSSTWGVQGLDYLLSIMPLDSAWTMQEVLSSDCKVLARLFPYKREAPLGATMRVFLLFILYNSRPAPLPLCFCWGVCDARRWQNRALFYLCLFCLPKGCSW